LIKWKSDFWTYTATVDVSRLTSHLEHRAMNFHALRSTLKYVSYLTTLPKMIRRC